MLNRRHIRVKVMQALYAWYCSSDNRNITEAEKELIKSQKKLFELYLYILLFLKEFICFVETYDDETKSRNFPGLKEKTFNSRFYQNPVALKLVNSKDLEKTFSENNVLWNPEDVDMLRKIFIDLKNTEIYQEYVRSDSMAGVNDIGINSFIIKHYSENFSLLEQHFEEKYINWYDDYSIVVKMAVKSFQMILDNPDNNDFIQPLSPDTDDSFQFSLNLFRAALNNEEYLNGLIKSKVEKWEPTRLPVIDTIILQIGLSEFLYFPNIPVKVTINECIELAKNYSTPNSKKFINGVLDNLLAELKSDDKIKKTGLGLVND